MSEQQLAPSELRYLLLSLSREWERAVLEQENTRDLTSAQVEILLVLNEAGSCSMMELGEMLLLNRDPFRSVDSLAAKGLVVRGSGTDKRKVLWSLTPDGTALAGKIINADFSLFKKYSGTNPAEHTSMLVKLLRELQSTVAPANVLQNRFGPQQSPVEQLLTAAVVSEVQTNRSSTVSLRLRTVIEIKDGGDVEAAYEKYSPLLAARQITVTRKSWNALVEQGGPASDYFLENLSEVLTGTVSYLLTDDERTIREVENRMRAENALAVAGVTGFGGRGTLDAGALQALAELVQKRLGTTDKD
ncbi:MarR family winged helix-turn-helix transcriptional regulator [Arthrobacter sunyaminii]|uniref:MarR family winged helix-turn-helix transcriptional regulator n=1 Tax=Arthrobacter sunyaminii TaxID=2816859 RepID=UPI001A953ED1|nr:MarR family winged helix-turn-helix transcriptional regulator [Arthrobacter sunyaminii]MBO0910093.1 winged helix-turn-helix transcriptional regulator [Arthrobacter sunyaminii]